MSPSPLCGQMVARGLKPHFSHWFCQLSCFLVSLCYFCLYVLFLWYLMPICWSRVLLPFPARRLYASDIWPCCSSCFFSDMFIHLSMDSSYRKVSESVLSLAFYRCQSPSSSFQCCYIWYTRECLFQTLFVVLNVLLLSREWRSDIIPMKEECVLACSLCFLWFPDPHF